MKPKHVIAVDKSGEIYIPKMTTRHLGIFGWAGVMIVVEKTYIHMRFLKQSLVMKKDDEIIVKLQKKSGGRQAMIGGCRKFAEAINSDFGDTNRLDLRIKTMFTDEESVRISLDRPSRIAEKSTPESAEEANEISLGTVSKPAEKQLGIFRLAENKPTSSPRIRPLPDGLPEWLRGPFSRGEHVWVAIRVPGEKANQGWAIGVHQRFDLFSIAVADDTEYLTKVHLYHPKYIFQSKGTLRPSAECFKIAGKLGIGLSALQIEAINSGGVPSEDHGLPDEMFG